MANNSKAVIKSLVRDFVNHVSPDATFTTDDAARWVEQIRPTNNNYARKRQKHYVNTMLSHFTTNAREVRTNEKWKISPSSDQDLYFRIKIGVYERYKPGIHPAPFYFDSVINDDIVKQRDKITEMKSVRDNFIDNFNKLRDNFINNFNKLIISEEAELKREEWAQAELRKLELRDAERERPKPKL